MPVHANFEQKKRHVTYDVESLDAREPLALTSYTQEAVHSLIYNVNQLKLKNTCTLSENGNFGSAKVLKYKKGSASQKAWEPLI
jgi:hypothetical protein